MTDFPFFSDKSTVNKKPTENSKSKFDESDALQKLEEFLSNLEKTQRVYFEAVDYLWELRNQLNIEHNPDLRQGLQKDFTILFNSIKNSEEIILKKTAELKKYENDYSELFSKVS